jgi:hypothetical protein
MLPGVSQAAVPRQAAPRRMAFIYIPNGAHMAAWTPTITGSNFQLPSTLEPLAPVRSNLLILSNLTLDKARPHGDGPGDHARAMASFLTGRQARKTHGADLRLGVSVDQVAAAKLGAVTRFPSVELGCEGGLHSGNCDSGYSCAYSANVSWKTESTPMPKEVNPRLAFERLFGGPSPGEADAARARRERQRKSILDFVTEDATLLRAKLGGADRRKLDEYLSSVRDLEVRLGRTGNKDGTTAAAPGTPHDYGEHLRLMADVLVLAFQGDLTRVATFVFANDGSNRSYRFMGVPEGHHDLSHHGGKKDKQEKIGKINRFHISQLAYLLQKMKGVKEGNGTLLDNVMVVYGSGISDGNRHNHEDLPVLLAGGGGGTIQGGRHLACPKETPLTNLYVALLERMGMPVDRFGDSTGKLPGLSG